ncbi:hypothetical protein AUJ14_05825 [Candidatus Micrarchaeota archaeon CG1_02_55_22]|nr:MAG: hypothetical protein AUJ14_05825 [Candidatus Micrarchaeota archaeon CG1_02_55_22]
MDDSYLTAVAVIILLAAAFYAGSMFSTNIVTPTPSGATATHVPSVTPTPTSTPVVITNTRKPPVLPAG